MHRTLGVLIVILASAGGLTAQDSTPAVAPKTVAHVYIGPGTIGNTPEKIHAFAVSSAGGVTAVSGSPFLARSLQTAVNSGYVFGTDGTYITSYRRTSTGGLQAVSTINGLTHNDTPKGSIVGSLKLDHTGTTLYAGEYEFQGADNNAYAVFKVGSNGALTFRTNSAISVDYGSPLQFSPNNQFAYNSGCYFADWQLNAFKRASNGTLMSFNPAAAMPPNPNDDICPFLTAVSAKGYLAVAYTDYVVDQTHVAIYRIASNGDLVMVDATAISSLYNMAPSDMRFDPSGVYLAIAGKGIQTFSLNSNGTMARLGSVLDSSVVFGQVAWDKNAHVYALSNTGLYLFYSHQTGLTKAGGPFGGADSISLSVLPVN